MLIVLEGTEGVGKSTQVRRLHDVLSSAGRDVVAVREPGGTPVGDAIRALLLESSHGLDPRAEALLFMASRAQLVRDVIRPALERGAVVLTDRFFLSTYAYQIAGRGLPEEDVRRANALATGGLIPDLTVLLDLPEGEGMRRAAVRGAHDRIERSGDEFHRRVHDAFRRFADPLWQAAHPECGAIARVDASGGEADVTARVLEVLAGRWPRTFALAMGSHS